MSSTCKKRLSAEVQTLEDDKNDMSKNQLLLSYVEPHQPVVSCTIAGWLIKVMKSAGINKEEFKAHSVRGATTSKAQAKRFVMQGDYGSSKMV